MHRVTCCRWFRGEPYRPPYSPNVTPTTAIARTNGIKACVLSGAAVWVKPGSATYVHTWNASALSHGSCLSPLFVHVVFMARPVPIRSQSSPASSQHCSGVWWLVRSPWKRCAWQREWSGGHRTGGLVVWLGRVSVEGVKTPGQAGMACSSAISRLARVSKATGFACCPCPHRSRPTPEPLSSPSSFLPLRRPIHGDSVDF
jgi:hypothetical protein